jgi:hypothetical protein
MTNSRATLSHVTVAYFPLVQMLRGTSSLPRRLRSSLSRELLAAVTREDALGE